MGIFYNYSVITLAILYCILFLYSNLKLVLSWCIVGLQKGIVSILAATYMLLLFFDLLMIIMIASYHNDLDQQQYVDHSKLPLVVRIIGEYVILYLNFIINGIILLCFLLFFSGLFGVKKVNKKPIISVIIIDIIYFIIIFISSMLIEFANINAVNIPILSYIYIITLVINTIWSIYCLYKLPIALPIDLAIGLYEKNTICSCYTTVTRYIWYILVIVLPQIIFLTLNILEIDIWDFHINDHYKTLDILSAKQARILYFSSQFFMLICIWNVLRISIKQNVELNIVLNVIKEIEEEENDNKDKDEKKHRLLSISEELATFTVINGGHLQQETDEIKLSLPNEHNTMNMKKGILVNQNSEQSEPTERDDYDDRSHRSIPTITNTEIEEHEENEENEENEAIKTEDNMMKQEVEMINVNMDNTANDTVNITPNDRGNNIESIDINNNREIFGFQVIVDGMMLYQDKELENEVFSIQIGSKQIVNGFYLDDECKIIYLTEYKVYISSMDVNEMPPNDDDMNNNKNMNITSNENEEEKEENDDEEEKEEKEEKEEEDDIEMAEKESIRFKVVVDGVCLYKDGELKEEIFSVQVHDKQIVNGYYIDDSYKIAYLTQFKLYISSMDIREIGDDEENEENEKNEDEEDNKTEAIGDQIPNKYELQSNYSSATTMITNSDNYNKERSGMAESESLDIHNYSMTTKINVAPSNLRFIPDVDDIDEESDRNDEVSDITPIFNTNDAKITPIFNMVNTDTPTMDLMDNKMDENEKEEQEQEQEEEKKEMEQNENNENIQNDEENMNEQKMNEENEVNKEEEESSISSSSFVQNETHKMNNNNLIQNEDQDEEDEDEESTVDTEINYSYSSTEATETTQTMTAPNIIVKFD